MQYYRRLFGLVFIVGLLTGFTAPARDQPPPIPHAFYGQITYHEAPASVGVEVEARGEGVLVDIPGNPIVTTAEGVYGQGGVLEAKLIVQGQVAQGTPLIFFVNDEPALVQALDGQWRLSFPYEEGGFTQLNLWVGPLPVPEPYLVFTQPLNAATNVPINAIVDGLFNEDITLENPDLVTIVGSVWGILASGPATLGADKRTLIIPHNPFSTLGERVVVTIGAGAVKDAALNPNLLYTWFFDSQDLTPPFVIAKQPEAAAENVKRDAIVTATFYEDVTMENADLATIVGSVSGILANGQAILGVDKRTLTIPHNDFNPLGEHVVVTIGAGAVEDLAHNPNLLHTWSFDTVDITPPYVVTTQPLDGAVNVARDGVVTATMNEDLTLVNPDLATIVGSVSGILANGPATLGVDKRTLIIPHNSFHVLGERVTVTLGYGTVENLDHNPNMLDSWYFDSRAECGLSYQCLFFPIISKALQNTSTIYRLREIQLPFE